VRMQDPAAVIEAIIRAANSGDLAGMMAGFAENAVLALSPALPGMPNLFQDREAIRGYLQQIVSNGFRVEPIEVERSGDEVRWRSVASGGLFGHAGLGRAEVSSRAIVHGGLIRTIDIQYAAATVRQLEAALVAQA